MEEMIWTIAVVAMIIALIGLVSIGAAFVIVWVTRKYDNHYDFDKHVDDSLRNF